MEDTSGRLWGAENGGEKERRVPIKIFISSDRLTILWMILLLLFASVATAQTQESTGEEPLPPNVNPAQHAI